MNLIQEERFVFLTDKVRVAFFLRTGSQIFSRITWKNKRKRLLFFPRQMCFFELKIPAVSRFLRPGGSPFEVWGHPPESPVAIFGKGWQKLLF